MPFVPPHPCSHPGCNILVRNASRCPRHLAEQRRLRGEALMRIEARRGTAASRGYGSRWQAARDLFLQANPLCRNCESHGRVVQAKVVDHIVPHKGDAELFWDKTNWQPLCRACHDRKTARECRFGNDRKCSEIG